MKMEVKEIRERSGLTQARFCKKYGVPLGTLRHWEQGDRKPAAYVLKLLERCVEEDITGQVVQEPLG